MSLLLRRGMSLLELSVTMAVSGVLLAGSISVGTAQKESERIALTQKRMEHLQDAITVYYRINGYLPCPSSGSYAATTSTFAREQPSVGNHAGANTALALTSAVKCNNVIYSYTGALGLGTPDIYIGVVPTRSLNLPDTYMYDAWGDRITYVVSSYCVARLNWSTFADTLYYNKYKCSSDGLLSGTLALLDLTDGAKIAIRDSSSNWVTSNPYIAYVLISHGKNGTGSWGRNGNRITGTALSSIAEKANGNLSSSGGALASNNTALTSAYYDMKINNGNIPANYFDDIVRFKTAPQIDYEASH